MNISHDSNNTTATHISILSMLRLSVGNTETGPPTDEEKGLVEQIFDLRNSMRKSIENPSYETTMIVALVASTQVLEDILCQYEDDMTDILSVVVCKLSHHGLQHMDLKDNPAQEIKFDGTIH